MTDLLAAYITIALVFTRVRVDFVGQITTKPVGILTRTAKK